MAPGAILRVRAALAELDTDACEQVARQALECAGTEEVLCLLRAFWAKRKAALALL